MKKGVVILGSLILAFAFCLPAVAQPSAKAVETIVIDSFDVEQEWTWNVVTSRFVADGYPIVKNFEGMPNSLRAYHKKSDPEPMVLGVKCAFDRKGDNWFEVYPEKDGEPYEPEFIGNVTQMDFWVWGANYNYMLEVMIRDAEGRVVVLDAGSLQFQGWRNIVLNIPSSIRQHSRLRSGRPDLTFVGFRIRSSIREAVDDYVIYFDQIKYTTNTLSNIYDGYELRDADFGESSDSSSGQPYVEK